MGSNEGQIPKRFVVTVLQGRTKWGKGNQM